MSNQASEIIAKYEVLFAARTGLTVLMPKTRLFNCGVEVPVSFRVSAGSPRDLVLEAENNGSLTIRNMQKEHIDEALSRGFIMVYELQDDEVVRCTPCSLLK
jgi:hypothetical protein